MSDIKLTDKSYLEFSQFLENQCGIVLGDNKQYLVKSRLGPLVTSFQLDTIDTLIQKAKSSSQPLLRAAVIDAMTTNETLWFRDDYPFNVFKTLILPELASKNSSLKIWSAASSSGQEPYSIAMAVAEYAQSNKNAFPAGVKITGTDISKTMLDHCNYAHYDSLALSRGLSDERKQKFFEPSEKNLWKVKQSIQDMVNFKPLNLLTSYSLLGKFDVVFCRNVLIYFSPEIKKQIISQIHNTLNPEGYLYLGASESLSGLTQEFSMIRCNPGIVYKKQ